MTEHEISRTPSAALVARARPQRGTRTARQLLAFALETALLFAAAYWAIAAFPSQRVIAAAAALGLAVLLWGLFMAPRAKKRLPWPALPLMAGGAFLAGAGALMISGLVPAAVLMAAAAVGNLIWDFSAGYPAVESSPRRTGRRSAKR